VHSANRSTGGMANAGHFFHPEDKGELDFMEPAMLFYAQESIT